MSGLKALLAGAVVALSATFASATTVTIYNDALATPPTGERGTLDCTSCEALLTGYNNPSIAWSSTMGQTFSGPSSASPTNETTYVNSLLNTSLTASSGNILGNGGNMSFSTDATYIFVKLGVDPEYFLIHNLLGGTQKFTWTQQAGTGSGLSHFITFGGTFATVPIPATGFLLIGALGGLGLIRKRRKAA